MFSVVVGGGGAVKLQRLRCALPEVSREARLLSAVDGTSQRADINKHGGGQGTVPVWSGHLQHVFRIRSQKTEFEAVGSKINVIGQHLSRVEPETRKDEKATSRITRDVTHGSAYSI